MVRVKDACVRLHNRYNLKFVVAKTEVVQKTSTGWLVMSRARGCAAFRAQHVGSEART